MVHEVNLPSRLNSEGLTAFENFVRVSLKNHLNLFYISDEKPIGENYEDIEPLRSIKTYNNPSYFANNHELLALAYKIGKTKINHEEVKNSLKNFSKYSNSDRRK